MKKVVIIGYSGHAYVVLDIFNSKGIEIIGYCEPEEKQNNPFKLIYLGNERDEQSLNKFKQYPYFTAIGDNLIRRRIDLALRHQLQKPPSNAIHKRASVSKSTKLGKGILIGNGAVINACSVIENGVICNTLAIIEHECQIGAYTHIAPGAILCGFVSVGENTVVGAGSVIKQGVKIGSNVTIGAGTVVIMDIPDGAKVVGNPQRTLP